MAKNYKGLGGHLASADGLIEDLEAFKTNDASPLTLLDDDNHIENVSDNVQHAIDKLEEVVKELRVQAGVMQDQADFVNSDSNGNLEW